MHGTQHIRCPILHRTIACGSTIAPQRIRKVWYRFQIFLRNVNFMQTDQLINLPLSINSTAAVSCATFTAVHSWFTTNMVPHYAPHNSVWLCIAPQRTCNIDFKSLWEMLILCRNRWLVGSFVAINHLTISSSQRRRYVLFPSWHSLTVLLPGHGRDLLRQQPCCLGVSCSRTMYFAPLWQCYVPWYSAQRQVLHFHSGFCGFFIIIKLRLAHGLLPFPNAWDGLQEVFVCVDVRVGEPYAQLLWCLAMSWTFTLQNVNFRQFRQFSWT